MLVRSRSCVCRACDEEEEEKEEEERERDGEGVGESLPHPAPKKFSTGRFRAGFKEFFVFFFFLGEQGRGFFKVQGASGGP